MSDQATEISDRERKLRVASVFAVCEPTDGRTDLDILEQLHTDVISRAQFRWAQSLDETRACLQRRQKAIEDAHRRGMLFIGGMTVSAMYLRNSNGTHVLSPDELAAMATRSPTNELVELGGYYHGCINNPRYFEYTKQFMRIIIDGGVDGIHFDEADSRWFHHRPYECFCDHCNEGLRRRLAARYTSRELLERFGIADIQRFDYRAYLQEHSWTECPGLSPLHHEWWLFQLEACRDRFVELMGDSQAYAERSQSRRLVNTANVYDPLWLPERCLESPHVEYVMIGSCLELRLREKGEFVRKERIPPQYSYVPLHLATRSCTPDRPVTFFIDWPPGVQYMLAQTPERQRDILKYLFAEAYACGVCFHAPYKSCYARWTGPLDVLTRYTGFFSREARCYRNARPVAAVGLLYSYASSIWDHFPMELAPSPSDPIHALQYYGVGQALLDRGIAFDSLFIGDGRIMDDTLTADQLARYEVIIAPCCYSMSDRQMRVLEQYVTAGGKLLVIGELATMDTERRTLDSAAWRAQLRGAGASVLTDLDYEAYLAQSDAHQRGALRDAVERLAGRPLCCVSGADKLMVLLTESDAEQAAYVHLINRDLTPDGYIAKSNVPVSVPLPKRIRVAQQAGRLASPDLEDSVLVEVASSEQAIRFVLPHIEIYAILELKRS